MLTVSLVRGSGLLMMLMILMMPLVLRLMLRLLLPGLRNPRVAIVLGVHCVRTGNGDTLCSQRRGDEQREGANDEFHVNSPIRMKLGFFASNRLRRRSHHFGVLRER